MFKSIPSPTSTVMGRFPRQIQRTVPIYIFAFFLFAFGFGPVFWLPSHSRLKEAFSLGPARITRASFPQRVWQIWKVPPLYFEEQELNRARNWTQLNPTYRYEVLTDTNSLPWVEEAYGPDGVNRPDVVHFYRSLSAKIIKADFLRYLIMYVEGGTYADIDVQALKPIDMFIPQEFKEQEKDIDMVVGVEVDQPQYKDHPVLGCKSMSFVQWTFMCKPQLPVMLNLINDIMAWINNLAAEQQVPISNVTLDFDAVISGSGPTKFTNFILSEMSQSHGKQIDWGLFHNMTSPKFIGGFLVLPVKAFASGQGHSNSGPPYNPHANIKHHYHASKWPLSHPRYNHPVFGQLEDCKWNPECVTRWDEDVAAFKRLDLEGQIRMVEEKKRDDEKRAREDEERWARKKAEKARKEEEEQARLKEEERIRMEKERKAWANCTQPR